MREWAKTFFYSSQFQVKKVFSSPAKKNSYFGRPPLSLVLKLWSTKFNHTEQTFIPASFFFHPLRLSTSVTSFLFLLRKLSMKVGKRKFLVFAFLIFFKSRAQCSMLAGWHSGSQFVPYRMIGWFKPCHQLQCSS